MILEEKNNNYAINIREEIIMTIQLINSKDNYND